MKPFVKAILWISAAVVGAVALFALAANLIFANNGSDVVVDPSPTLTREGETGKIQVVTSTQVWADITEILGGEWVEVTVLVPDNQDPHSYEATARDQLAVSEADLVIANGGGYDEFMDQLVPAAGTELVFLKLVEGEHIHAGETEHDHAEEESHDHAHEENEHIWYDFAQTLKAAEHIVEAIIELRPEAAETSTAGFDFFTSEMDNLEIRLEALREKALGLGFVAPEGVANLLLLNAGFVNMTPEAMADAIEEERDVPLNALEEAKRLLTNKTAVLLVVNVSTQDAVSAQLITAAEAGARPIVKMGETAGAASPGVDLDYLDWMNLVIDQLQEAIY
jgi:zinc/manganese transport system substrate-binding protein